MDTLFTVNPEEARAILAIPVPPHPETTFDEETFQNLVAFSFSMITDEKREMIESVGKFSQHQIDEVMRILREDKQKFEELNKKHNERLEEIAREENDEEQPEEETPLDHSCKHPADRMEPVIASDAMQCGRCGKLDRDPYPEEKPATKYEYQVQGRYNGNWEEVSAYCTMEEAREGLREYDENERDVLHRIRKVREA